MPRLSGCQILSLEAATRGLGAIWRNFLSRSDFRRAYLDTPRLLKSLRLSALCHLIPSHTSVGQKTGDPLRLFPMVFPMGFSGRAFYRFVREWYD